MPGGIVDGALQAVEPVSIVKFIHWLRCWIVPEVVTGIRLGSEYRAELAAPVTQFHLVVSEIRTDIEEDTVTSFHVDPHVAFPQVAVDDAWFQNLAIFLEWPKKFWDDDIGHLLRCPLHLWPRAVGFRILLADAEQEAPVEDSPVFLPVYGVSNLTITRLDSKAEFPRW